MRGAGPLTAAYRAGSARAFMGWLRGVVAPLLRIAMPTPTPSSEAAAAGGGGGGGVSQSAAAHRARRARRAEASLREAAALYDALMPRPPPTQAAAAADCEGVRIYEFGMHESALALRLLEPFWTAAPAEEEEGAATTTWHPCACERCVYVGLMDACSFMDVRPVLPVGTAPKARGGGRGRGRDPDAGRGVAGGRGAAAAGGRGARVVVRGAPRQHHRGRREGEKGGCHGGE